MKESFIPILFLSPLIGFLLLGIVGGILKIKLPKLLITTIACGSVLISFIISLLFFYDMMEGIPVLRFQGFPWLSAFDLDVALSFKLDPLSLALCLVVTGVGFLIHLYSVGYMKEDPGYTRYFAYLNLFTASMLILVLAEQLPLLFVGWEGVGLCSYLLIGFWYEDNEKAWAGRKAFVVNRIGDVGFLLGIFLTFTTLGTTHIGELEIAITQEAAPLFWIALLLFIGAVGKSAQLPLYVWLPDAMAGPTPVSALIHAATMVTAGVYMIARLHFLYSATPPVATIVAVTGGITALYAALIALTQNDIKKILAYSTISQLGYMFLAVGVGAYGSGIFHLMTHAFFKALLFLCAGAIIHALAGEQNIQKMGGLHRQLPWTYGTFLVGTCALAGIPPFCGFFSKDEILFYAYQRNPLLWGVGWLTTGLTACYMFRAMFLVFHGKQRSTHHPHEAPKVMLIPLIILAALSLGGGVFGFPPLFQHWTGMPHLLSQFLLPIFSESEQIENLAQLEVGLMGASMTLAVVVSLLTLWFYNKKQSWPKSGLIDTFSQNIKPLYWHLWQVSARKFYVDELYDIAIVKPMSFLAAFFTNWIDIGLIDRLVNWCGIGPRGCSALLSFIQTGNVQNYALIMLMGFLFLAAYFLVL